MQAQGLKRRNGEVLNVCFHGIGVPGRPLEKDEEIYWVAEARFDELLAVIGRYPFIRITFDDGNASDAHLALPLLRRHGLSATFFVISQRLDQPGSLTSTDIRELVRSGMGIGSHGARHRSWRDVTDAELHDELTGAATAIAGVAGRPVREVACPFGAYDRRVLRAVRRSGFQRVYTVDGGPASSDAWLQARYSVRGADTPEGIERLARSPGGGALQAAARAGKGLVKRCR